MKKNIIFIGAIIVLIISLGISVYFNVSSSDDNKEQPLPKQEKSEGLRGAWDIDKNVNEKTIDNYLGRSDTVYRDVRMLTDPATWENKGGERELIGFIEGFEVVPFPYLTEYPQEYIDEKTDENVLGLYAGETLFSIDENGNYIANYEESMEILEYLFPKDKYIFLMCGGGGYAYMTKNMLVSLGWDETKIYNIGGYLNYEGNHKVSTINNHGTETTYDYWKVAYHDIDFSSLTEIN